MKTEKQTIQAAIARSLKASHLAELQIQARVLMLEAKVEALEYTLQAVAIKAGVDRESVQTAYRDFARGIAVDLFARKLPNLPDELRHLGPQLPPVAEGAPPAID